eukprot:10847452-Alexandrium_andersonii.AAC.1
MDFDPSGGLPPRSEEGRSVITGGAPPQDPGPARARGVMPELSGGRSPLGRACLPGRHRRSCPAT